MSRKGSCLCPACGKDLAPKAIHDHTRRCSAWKATVGEPWPWFKFSAKPEMYVPEAVEGQDFVRCLVCAQHGWDFRFRRMVQHLQCHGLTEETYAQQWPEAKIRLDSTTAKREATVQDRYGVRNVFQDATVKAKSRESMLDRWGYASPMQSPELRAKAAETNLERYGAENPFASSQIQEKIRATNLDKFGVENPNQSPEVMGKRVRTNLERYGEEHYFETAAFKRRLSEVSLERYGVEHPMQSSEVQARLATVLLAKYGVSNPGSSPEIQAKAMRTNKARHGGVHHLARPEWLEARKQTLLAQYGVDNISKVPAIKEKIVRSITARWYSGAIPKKTKPERTLEGLVPERVVYSGNWAYWVTWANGRRKNPDFVLLTEEQLAAYRMGVPLNDLRTHTVIEVNGVWWHTKKRGYTRIQREQEFVDGYASIGVTCLVVWEDELLGDPDGVEAELARKLFSCSQTKEESK